MVIFIINQVVGMPSRPLSIIQKALISEILNFRISFSGIPRASERAKVFFSVPIFLFQQKNRVRLMHNKEMLTRINYDILQTVKLQNIIIYPGKHLLVMHQPYPVLLLKQRIGTEKKIL